MNRPRQIPAPTMFDASRLCSADHLRWYVANHPVWGGLTDEKLGEKLGLSAGFVGMVLNGSRQPSKAFLDAIGWEAVTLYQMRTVALSSTQSGEPK